MAYTLKDFASDCITGGRNLVAALTPPLLYSDRVTYVLGTVVGVAVMPFINGATIGWDKLSQNWQVWKRGAPGAAEKRISDTFGRISSKGYKHWGGGVELKLEEAQVVNVYANGETSPEADITRMDTHHNREQCAKDMLGNLAQGATPYGRAMGNEERFIVVRRKGEAASAFYKSVHIDSPANAPADSIIATHHYYKSAIGHGGVDKESFYAITPVDAPTTARLKSLGL